MKVTGSAGSLEEIFTQAKEAYRENKATHQIALEQEQQRIREKLKDEEDKRQFRVQTSDPEEANCSEELYGYIKEFNFTVDAYEKNNAESDEFGRRRDETLETYYCSYGAWHFKIRNFSDVDIEEGIFSLTEITHKETAETVDFYCDLGCRNTSESRRDEVIAFLNYSSLDAYIQDEYGKYLRLPDLLRKEGFHVTENDFSFGLNNAKGYLELEENLYVKVYRGWYDDLRLVVTNDNHWNVNSSNGGSKDKKAYYFDYNSVDAIDELAICIGAFKEEQAGEIGYFENGRYHSNEDVYAFYRSLRNEKDFYKDAWNHYQIRMEHTDGWDHRGYDEENSMIVNKYKGLELFVETELTFNDAAQWSKGSNINKSRITFEYDRRKSNECRLFIQNYVYADRLMYHDEETDDYRLDETKCTGTWEAYGTFSSLMEQLKQYVHTMIAIHEVEL